ncbi:unnamed protein product [Ceutorhynchus assimilis]|uniref:MADF domain-containing protein n=1 Tax=Ceutorhynchus assimilis TaxID=467358 RepID=A0A9N9MGJ4_9CUCU|nr:unnamed protein product [Ceutorhynchus assimilis]
MEKRVWNREEATMLIENFELYPELWEVHCKDFKNRVMKQAALEKLTGLFETSENKIQRKLHNLRTQMNQEWRKIQKRKSGKGTNETYKSTWEFFDSLKFIITANAQSSTQDNLISSDFEQLHSLECVNILLT